MNVYDFAAVDIRGVEQPLSSWRGQVLLIVNVASRCGFTPQYAGLEELYQRYRGRGFAVLGFPCNQFGAQEPGNESAIASFCEEEYGVTFPLFTKVDVNGAAAHPLFRYLKRTRPGLLGTGVIKWNFTKFLVGRDGEVRARFAPTVTPAHIEPRIAELLDTREAATVR